MGCAFVGAPPLRLYRFPNYNAGTYYIARITCHTLRHFADQHNFRHNINLKRTYSKKSPTDKPIKENRSNHLQFRTLKKGCAENRTVQKETMYRKDICPSVTVRKRICPANENT